MIYKLKMMSGQEIPLESEDAVRDLLREANSGKKLVMTKYGIVNIASIDSITPFKEKMAHVQQLLELGRSREESDSEALGVSPFAKILAPQKAMLSPQSRSEAQEESSREERQL